MNKDEQLLSKLKRVAQDRCWTSGGNDLMWFDNAEGMSIGVDWVEERFYVADLNDVFPSVAFADFVGLDVLFEEGN